MSASSWTATAAGPRARACRARWGHETGRAEQLRRVIEAAPDRGIGTLTAYAFSSDNWKRPQAEVDALMALLETLSSPTRRKRLVREGVRPRRDGRATGCRKASPSPIECAELATQRAGRLHLAHRHRLFRPRRDHGRREAGRCGQCALARRFLPASSPARQSLRDVDLDHPHRRRKAAVGFSPLGKRLCRIVVHRPHVARIHAGGSRRCDCGIPREAEAVRGIGDGGGRVTGHARDHVGARASLYTKKNAAGDSSGGV